MSTWFLWLGDPIWLIAAANFTYLIGICMPSVAVWLLRRDTPDMSRPYRAPRGTIIAGVCAAAVWMVAAMLGFEQFGISTVMFGLDMAYSGAALYAWRKFSDRRRAGLPGIKNTLYLKLIRRNADCSWCWTARVTFLAVKKSLPPSDSALRTACRISLSRSPCSPSASDWFFRARSHVRRRRFEMRHGVFRPAS